jgi:hypothetical protein
VSASGTRRLVFFASKTANNKTMHRSGRSAALDFRDFFGGHSVMVAVTRLRSWNALVFYWPPVKSDSHWSKCYNGFDPIARRFQ